MEEELKKFLESLNGKGLTKEQMSLAADTFVKEYKPKKPSSSKGGFTGQNMGSASASVNGGSSLGLKKTPQTYLAQAQEAEMRRNSIGQESKPTVAPKIVKQNKQIDADIARESSVNKSGLSAAEKVSATLKKANIKSPTAGTESLDQLDDTPVAPTTQFETDKTKSINKDPYNPQYKAVSDDEVNKVASHFDGDELEGIDKKDFATYLKNNTDYYESHTGVKNLLAKSLSTYSNIISGGLNGKLAEMAGADPDFNKKAVLEEYEKHKLKSLDREYNYGNPEKRSEISEKIMKTISYKKSVNREEFDQAKEYFNGIEQSGINPLEFSKYLKNKTDFYKNGAVTSDHAAEEEFAKDHVLKGYIKDREDKLATMYKYSQDEEQRSSIKSSVEDLHKQYNNFKAKFLPNITAVEKQKVERDAKVYSDLKSGKNRGTSFLQGVEDVTDAFYYGLKKPVQDVIAAGADAVGSNIGEEMRNNQNYVGWYRDKGVGGEVRVKGKSVSYKGNNYTVTEHGQIYDNDTETMINSFSKEEDLKAIANLSKESKKENQFFDQKAAFTHISSAASFLAMIALTKNVTTGTAAGLGMGAKTAATASQIAEQTAMIGTMAASGYSDTVNQLKQAGVSDIDAKSQGIKAGIVSGAVAAFAGKILNLPTSTKFAQNSAFKSVVNDFNKAFINGGEAGANEYLKSGMIKTLSKFGDMTKGGAHFAGFTLMQEAATAAINGNINESLGKEILDDKITADEVINHTIASFVSGSVLALGGNAKLNEYQKMDYLSNNLEKFKSVTQAKVEKGLMTLEEANNSLKTLVKFRKYSGKIPENISAEKVVDLLDILEKRDDLENKKKNTDKAFHEDINNELAKLKEKTEEIIGRKEDVELTDKEAALKSIKEVGKISKAFRVNKDENFEYKIDGKTYVAETREEAERSVERHYMENKDKPDEYLEAEQNHLEKVIDSLEAGKEGSSEKDIKRADQTIKSLRDRVENIKNERKSREDKAAESADPTKNGEGKEGEGINAKAKNTEEVSNFKAETERVATTKMEEETGHTFNLDGTTYDQGGLVIPVVSKNMKQSELTPEAIQAFKEEHADKIGGEAVKVGIYKFPDSDQVSIDLNIVVPNTKREEAIAFGKESGQESLFDLGTFENIKTGADGKNPKSYTAEEFKDIARRFEADKDPIGFKESEGTVEQSVSQPVDKFIDSPAKFDSPTDGKLSGTIKQDGQRLVFESGEKVFDLGNIKEVEGKSLKDLGLSVHDEVSINKNGNIEIRGKEYVNRYSNEESAVTRDSDGKVKSVTLDTPKGEKRTFKGQTAEDIVYAMKTKKFSEKGEDLVDVVKFSEFIDKADELLSAIEGKESSSSTGETKFSKGKDSEPNKSAVAKVLTPLLRRLKLTGLAKDAVVMTTSEMNKFAAENKILGYEENDGTKGFVYKDTVYLNSDNVTGDTAIHEFGHLWLNAVKGVNSRLYTKGMELIKSAAGEEYVRHVKETQPNLEGERLYEEALTQAIGENGQRLVEERMNTEEKSWIKNLWEFVAKKLGISKINPEDLANLTLDEYATSVAVDLLNGQSIKIVDPEAKVFRPIKDPKDSYLLSHVKKSDIIDFPSLVKDIIATGKKVSFWAADQLGIGKYTDKNGIEHTLDAGISFALDPANRKRGVIWASGAPKKTIDGLAKADYVFMTSGSPIQSKMFNKVVFGVFEKAATKVGGTYEGFVKLAKENGANGVLLKLLGKYKSFEELSSTADRKEVLKDLYKAMYNNKGEVKTTPFAKFLDKNNLTPDFEGMRDGFLKENGFNTNDVVLVLKISGAGKASKHSTYDHEVMGEVVGIPNIVLNASYLLPKPVDEARVNIPLAGAGGIKNNVDIKNQANFSKGKPQGDVDVASKNALTELKKVAKETRNSSEAIKAATEKFKESTFYKKATPEQKAEFDSKGLLKYIEESQAKKAAEAIVKSEEVKATKGTKGIVRENTGQTDKSKTVTVKESTLLRDKFANLARGFKTGVKETQELKRDFIIQVRGSIQGLGKYITDAEAKTILNQVANVTETNLDKVSAVVDNLAARLENRAEKAFLNRISKMQKQAGIKARTKYGNAGENINNLIKIPADQIPKSMLREYADLMEGLSKGKNVDFDKVNDLYARMRQDILDHVELKNTLKNQPNAPADPTKKVEAMDKLRGVKASMTSIPTGKLTDFERGLLRSFIKMPEKYLESLTVEDINGLSKGLEQLSATGFVPNKVFADVVIKYQSTVAAKSIIDKVGDTLLKPVSGITAFIDGMKGKVDYSSTDFAKKIASNMFHHIDSTINGIKGTAFYDNIVHPVTSNLDKSASETNKIGQLAADYMKRAIKENGSGFKVNVRTQLVLRQREFESNPELHGTKVFELDEHMKALDKERNNIDYTRDDLSVIEAEYAKVKGKTAQEMFDALSPAEKDLINFMDAHLADMQTHNRNFNNHLQGETLTYPKNYFPKRDSYTVGNPNANAEFRDRLSGVGGSTNVKSGVSNERVALGANPLDFNTVNNFMRNIGEGNMEKNLGLPLKTVFATITNLRKSDNGSLVKLANALDKTMGDLIDTQLHKSNYSYDTMGEQVFAKFTKNTFTRMLIDPIRLSYDVASNYSTVYGAYVDKMPLIIKANKMLDSEVTKAIHDNVSSTQAERLGGARSSDYKVASGTTIGRMGNRKANPDFVESMVDLYKHNKLSDKVEKMGDTYYKYADLPAQHLWKMNLVEQFKKITGKEFDGKKYLADKAYREEVQDSLQEATTQADKKTANYFNTGSSTEQKLKVQQGKGNLLYRANNFLRSFTFNENKVFWDATNKLTGFGSSTFENKGEAFRAFAVVNARSIAYSYLGQVVGNMIVKAVMGQDDSEEDEEALDKKAFKRAVGQHGMLILGGNTGAVQNLVGNLAFEMLNEKITTKVQGSYNAYEDNIFYVPNGRSKYTDFLNNLGAEGLAIKTLAQSVEGTYKMIDTFSEEGEITTEDIVRFKTFQYSTALISQSTGLPLDRVGRITQKVLQKKYPYNSKKGSSTGMGSSGGMGSMGMGSGMK